MSVIRTKVAGLILAAGAGRRFGGGKQWATYEGQPLLAHAINHCLRAGCDPVWVVTGFSHQIVAGICREFGAQSIYHKSWAEGMASSVNYGLSVLLEDKNWANLVVMAGDMPWFDPTVFLTNEVASLAANNERVMAIQYPEGLGMPLLLPRAFVQEHCYFASQSEKHNYRMKDSLKKVGNILTIPAGRHTGDIDRPEDLVDD